MLNSSDMAMLGYPDAHNVNAALGWLDLRVPAEARAELQQVSAANSRHPEVLEVWWRIHAAELHWDEALRIAELELQMAPDRMSGWVDRSYSLHELQRTQEAREALLPAVGKFPQASLIPYNLACYACRLGNPAEAQQWLVKAIARGEKDEIKRLALNDPDLATLRQEILKL
ncbi:MAG: tetratricopeptide repeat protein [Limisphaerales bacterium]